MKDPSSLCNKMAMPKSFTVENAQIPSNAVHIPKHVAAKCCGDAVKMDAMPNKRVRISLTFTAAHKP